jgi:hypothetical protein
MIETSLVHIYNMASPAQFVGCGAMVEGGYIATCRHVWRKASDEQGVVTVAFPYAIEDQKPAARPGTLADACETDANEPVVDLVLLRVDDPPDKLRGTGLQITRDPDFESGEAYALARIPTKKNRNADKGRDRAIAPPGWLAQFRRWRHGAILAGKRFERIAGDLEESAKARRPRSDRRCQGQAGRR